MATLRICFVGDSITVGSGDVGFLGWPGQVCVAETRRGHDVTLYNMGVRGDTSEMIAPRWRSECAVRLPDHVNGRLVFSFGVNDTAEELGVGVRVPEAQSIANARDILGAAREWLPTLMLGPIPTVDDMQPYVFPNGIAYHFDTARTASLNAGYAELCDELGIPYLDLYESLSANPDWDRHQRACDGVHAVGEGYALIAEQLAGWPAWRSWFEDTD
ncbi:MAG: lipase [Alphaproteobacteria bacterium]|nr:lipase [Alphaproteobacteria bacterium]